MENEKYKQSEGVKFWVEPLIHSVIIGISIFGSYASGLYQGINSREIQQISMPSTNTVTVTYNHARKENFYQYEGTFRTKEDIESKVREDEKNQLEARIQKKLNKL